MAQSGYTARLLNDCFYRYKITDTADLPPEPEPDVVPASTVVPLVWMGASRILHFAVGYRLVEHVHGQRLGDDLYN